MDPRNSPELSGEVLAQHIHPEVLGWHKLYCITALAICPYLSILCFLILNL